MCKDRVERSYQDLVIDFYGREFHVSCQDVNFHKSLDMICVWQVFGEFQKFTVIAEIFILNSGGITTICGNRISNEKVWIKVCNVNSQEKSKRVCILTMSIFLIGGLNVRQNERFSNESSTS